MSSNGAPEGITLADYLIARLRELSVGFVQGVPGDYSLGLLSKFSAAGLPWIGNANELNGAYSADGVVRALGPRRPSVVVTTMGVGELSAANGIAGCHSERIPVVHIVGTPATSAQFGGKLLHHTLGDHKFNAFSEMARQITSAQLDFATLKREGRMPDSEEKSNGGQEYQMGGEDAARELDRILEHCIKEALPVYIALPSDLVHYKLPKSCEQRLKKVPLDTNPPPNDEEAEAAALESVVSLVEQAKCPVILVDACTIRHDVVEETRELVEQSGLAVFSTPMGKTAMDESLDAKQFGGIYIGSNSAPDVKEIIEEKADLVIAVGTLLSDFNTGSFTYRTKRERTIELHSNRTVIGFGTYNDVRMKHLLPKLSQRLAKNKETRLKQTIELVAPTRKTFTNELPSAEVEAEQLGKELTAWLGGAEKVHKETITQAYLWPRVGQFLRPGDRVLGETGTSAFGLMEVRFPKQSQFIAQVLWGSIGWSCGATLGVALGARQAEKEGKGKSRTILFIGDGSLQLTLQEIGTMIRVGLTPLLFVLNNDGYEIERQIHGEDEGYNDVQPYNHSLLLDALRPPPDWRRPSTRSHAKDPVMSKTAYHAVHTKQQLDALLTDEEFNKADKCTLIEIFVPRGDAPAVLKRQAELSAGANSY